MLQIIENWSRARGLRGTTCNLIRWSVWPHFKMRFKHTLGEGEGRQEKSLENEHWKAGDNLRRITGRRVP